MPRAPIVIEKTNVWNEMLKSILPVLIRAWMAHEYMPAGISETQYKKLTEAYPELQDFFEKKDKQYILKPEYQTLLKQLGEDRQKVIEGVIGEYLEKEALKHKILTNPFTYLGGLDAYLANPVVMASLLGLYESVRAKERQRKREELEGKLEKKALGLLDARDPNQIWSTVLQMLPLLMMLR